MTDNDTPTPTNTEAKTDPKADSVDEDTAAADRANGEPDATHPTGEAQAEENRENDPPG